MKCVSKEKCGCYDSEGNHYEPGEHVPPREKCQYWYDTFHLIKTDIGAKVNNTYYASGVKLIQ